MAHISHSALLVCILAHTAWSSDRSLQDALEPTTALGISASTVRVNHMLSPLPEEVLHEELRGVTGYVCGIDQSDCAAHGHAEICCPVNTTCHRTIETHSQTLCCPSSIRCSHATPTIVCPLHTFACSSSLNGGCCPIGLRCAKSQCLEYEYKTLAVHGSIPPVQPQFSPPWLLAEAMVPSQPSDDARDAGAVLSTENPLRHAPAPTQTTVISSDKWADLGRTVEDLPIDERTWGKPTAWSAKIGEVAISRGVGQHPGAESALNRLIWLLGSTAALVKMIS